MHLPYCKTIMFETETVLIIFTASLAIEGLFWDDGFEGFAENQAEII
jgi:hypothetical protein